MHVITNATIAMKAPDASTQSTAVIILPFRARRGV
jgi:hypothetical protein